MKKVILPLALIALVVNSSCEKIENTAPYSACVINGKTYKSGSFTAHVVDTVTHVEGILEDKYRIQFYFKTLPTVNNTTYKIVSKDVVRLDLTNVVNVTLIQGDSSRLTAYTSLDDREDNGNLIVTTVSPLNITMPNMYVYNANRPVDSLKIACNLY